MKEVVLHRCHFRFTKLHNATISFVMAVCRHGTTQLPKDIFSRSFT